MTELLYGEHPNHPFPGDRNYSIKWARKMLADPRMVIVDTETTGLKDTDEVIEIGIINASGDVLYESRFNPIKRRLYKHPERAEQITLLDLKECPRFGDKWEEILSHLDGREIVFYNMEFDARLLGQTGEKHGVTKKANLKAHCAMIAYASFCGEIGPRKKGGYKWHKLPGAAHGAVADCRATLEVMRHISNSKLHLSWWQKLLGYPQ